MRHRDPEIEDIDFTRAALAMCENVDWNVGRVVEKVTALGLTEQTIMVYFCDNGPNGWRWNGDMKGRKGSTDEGGVRSPLFVSWPGSIRQGKVIEEISGAIDLLPTLADLAGISNDTNQPLDGLSLEPLMLNERAPWAERLIFSHWGGRISVRAQRYRLDHLGDLYDMELDHGQTTPVNDQFGEIHAEMLQAKGQWESEVLGMMPEVDERPFPVGCPGFPFTQLPARDGVPHGHIERSNQFPNCSFFTNWIATSDSISWSVEVMESGTFEVEIYYTCPKADIGSTFELVFGDERLQATVTEAHDPPLFGMEHDRVPRNNSYVKDFKPWRIGEIYLEKGRGNLTIKALNIPGGQVMDFRLMMLTRVV